MCIRDSINISRKIGTFETSIEPYEDCCTIFTPVSYTHLLIGATRDPNYAANTNTSAWLPGAADSIQLLGAVNTRMAWAQMCIRDRPPHGARRSPWP